MSRRGVSIAVRAASWLPLLFCGLRVMAQTSGLPAPVAGDCVANGTAVTCTKSNGVALGALATQSAVTMGQVPAGITAFVPAVTPVPVDSGGLEYPMLEGSGTMLTDVSGNGNNGALAGGANAPAWLPYGGLSFNDAVGDGGNATAKYATTPLKAWASLEAYVCMPTMGQTTGTGGPSSPGAQYATLWGPNSGTGVSALFASGLGYTQNGTSAYPTTYNVSGSFGSASLLPYGNCHTYTFTLAGDQDHAYVDGVEIFYSATGRTGGAAGTSTGYVLGELSTTAANTIFHGSIRYLKVWGTTVLTAAQVQSDAMYVQGRIAARVTTPGFPVIGGVTASGGWTDSYPRLICAGDSLTAGAAGGGAAWCNTLTLLNAYAAEDWGISGAYMVDIERSAEMRWLPRLNGNSVAVLGGGSNDATAGQSAGTVWQAMRSAIHKAQPLSKQVYFWTVPSRTGVDAARDAVNAVYRANAAGSGGVLIDIAAIPQLGADGANANTACFASDRVHLSGPASGAGSCLGTLTGYGVLAKYVSNAINEAEGSNQASPDVTSSNAYVEGAANRYVVQTPTAAATHQMFDCLALTGHTRTLVNGSGSFPIQVSGASGQPMVGNTTVAPGSAATFTVQLQSAAAGGCFWLRTQ